MKLILFITIVWFGSFQENPNLEELRILYERAPQEEVATERLIELVNSGDSQNPLFLGYKGVGTMIMAKHTGNPFKKLSYFKKGKAILEEAIELESSNYELRFLRFSAQTQMPSFLGYNESIENDKSFLLSAFPGLEQGAFRDMVKSFLLQSDTLENLEKQQIH